MKLLEPVAVDTFTGEYRHMAFLYLPDADEREILELELDGHADTVNYAGFYRIEDGNVYDLTDVYLVIWCAARNMSADLPGILTAVETQYAAEVAELQAMGTEDNHA